MFSVRKPTNPEEAAMPTVVHFEIPFDDVDRAKTFYTDLFGWKIEKYEGGEYWMITTTDEKGESGVGGGMMQRRQPGQPIIQYIDVPSVGDHLKKVKDLGGQLIVPKMPVPGMGYFAVCQDTEGNSFGLWETDPNASFFADPAEVFIAIMAATIAADDHYSVDEMRAVWYEIEGMAIFEGHDYRDLESRTFKFFKKDPADPNAFEPQDIDLIVASARQMLSPDLKERAYKMALKLAHADRNLEGYVKEIDEREQALLDRWREGLEIDDAVARRIEKEVADGQS